MYGCLWSDYGISLILKENTTYKASLTISSLMSNGAFVLYSNLPYDNV